MNLTLSATRSILDTGGRPAPGRCFIHLDPVPAMVGSIHIPDTARDMKITNTAATGTVLAVTHKHPESVLDLAVTSITDFQKYVDGLVEVGDRVILALYDEDRDAEVIITRNEVVMAVVEA